MQHLFMLVPLCFCFADAKLEEKEDNSLRAQAINEPLNGLFQTKCIENLDCFYTGPPFYHPIYRPISFAPTSNLGTKFLLYTPLNTTDPEMVQLTEDSVRNSTFDSRLPTKILIHGYTVELKENDIRFAMKKEMLKEGLYNVIIVNWSDSNQFPYPQAVANARAVGCQVAKLINMLMNEKGISPQSVHVIGHSLGGQMAGWVGERVPGLGRITGLDPAGPYFQEAENEVRLDTTDANFVDVIHSNAANNFIGGLGLQTPMGHMDFYPNGGNKQPGCNSRDQIRTADEITSFDPFIANSCDHGRANAYFLNSINNCRFTAVQCSSYESFQNGDCTRENSTVAEMGFHAQKLSSLNEQTKFFLKTTDTSPYCIED